MTEVVISVCLRWVRWANVALKTPYPWNSWSCSHRAEKKPADWLLFQFESGVAPYSVSTEKCVGRGRCCLDFTLCDWLLLLTLFRPSAWKLNKNVPHLDIDRTIVQKKSFAFVRLAHLTDLCYRASRAVLSLNSTSSQQKSFWFKVLLSYWFWLQEFGLFSLASFLN